MEMITKEFYRKCLEVEVYGPYKEYVNRKLTIIDKIRCRYFSPELSAVYLIRKMQYYKGVPWGGVIATIIHNKLIKRYGLYISPNCQIGLGLRIYHPTSIVLTNAVIGENFTIFQNCTIGQKLAGKSGYGLVPRIGNNVTMYANSSIIGNVQVVDNVIIGAHACLIKDALDVGVYIGIPATLKIND